MKRLVFILFFVCIPLYCKAQIDNSSRIDSLDDLASKEYEIQNYTEAIRLKEESIELLTKSTIVDQYKYIISLYTLACYYGAIKDECKTIKLLEKGLCLNAKLLGKDDLLYKNTLSFFLEVCNSQKERINNFTIKGNYIKAIKEASEIKQSIENILGKRNLEYSSILNVLAINYHLLGNFEKAIIIERESLHIVEELQGKKNPTYVKILLNLAMHYSSQGNFANAILMGKEVLYLSTEIFTNNPFEYEKMVNGIISIYLETGNYEEALKLGEIILGIPNLNTHTEQHAGLMHNLAIAYAKLSKYQEAIELGYKVLNIQKSILGTNHIDYANSLLNLIGYNHLNKNYAEAIDLGKECITVFKKMSKTDHPNYAKLLHAIAINYYELGNINKSIELNNQAIRMLERFLNKTHPDYLTLLENVIIIQRDNKKTECFPRLWRNLYNLRVESINTYFRCLNSYDRSTYWNTQKKYFEETLPYYSFIYDFKSFVDLTYNGLLISKGILLNTDIDFFTLVSESNDTTIFNHYNQLKYNNSILESMDKKSFGERIIDIDSLDYTTSTLENLLIKESKIYGDFAKNLSIDWEQVQNELHEDEMALEFISFPINNDSIMYCALTLKKEYDVPHMIPLFEAKQLSKILPKNYYTSTAISQLVWKPLEKELFGINNIYFAPDGELYNIAIESLRHFNGKGYLFDEWNFYRLSSTRELVKVRKERNNPNVVLYGGLDYDANVLDTTRYMIEDYSPYTSTRSIPDSIGLNREYGPLTATLSEVLHIDSLCSIVNIPSTLYVGLDGTESSFKQLSGKGISNLHIATHGFYWKESELKNNSNLRNLSFITGDNKPRYIEDKAMTRSGLLLSGANAVLSGYTIPDLHEDGILTAQEISTLDFRGLDLLVLSACQTGLGEIKGDGVFGLQRGFKKAGAQTIIMSLWNVDDNATQMLMTEFYKNLISGLSKRESFIKAQNAVRNFKGIINGESRDFSNPKYWAAFIMLDGID